MATLLQLHSAPAIEPGDDLVELLPAHPRDRGATPGLAGRVLGGLWEAGRWAGLVPHPEPPEHTPTGLPDGKAISHALASGAAARPVRSFRHVRVSQLQFGGRSYALKEFHDVDNPDLVREAAGSVVARLAGVASPRVRRVTVHRAGGPRSGVQALVGEWVDGSPVSALPDDEALRRLRAVPREELSRVVLHDFLTGYVDSHQGNYILTPDDRLASIDRAEAFGNNPSVDVAPPSQAHRTLKMATGSKVTLDKYRPGEAEAGSREARAFPLSAAQAAELADKVPAMALALRRHGMDREAGFVERRGKALRAFAAEGGKTVGDLERLARKHSGARW